MRLLKRPDEFVSLLSSTLSNLATTLDKLGKTADAETFLREAVALKRKVLPPAHPDLAVSLNKLGVMLEQQGKLEEAELFEANVSPLTCAGLNAFEDLCPEGTIAQQPAQVRRGLAMLLKCIGHLAWQPAARSVTFEREPATGR